MRRKCRLADTWLTRHVLLDSWNVTLSQGAERCTLNLSPSNNHSPSVCLARAGCGNNGFAAEGKHIRRFLCAFDCEAMLKSSCPNYKLQVPLVFLFMQTQTEMLRICISSNILLHEYTGRLGKKERLLHISVADRGYKRIFFFYGLLIGCLNLGLNVL